MKNLELQNQIESSCKGIFAIITEIPFTRINAIANDLGGYVSCAEFNGRHIEGQKAVVLKKIGDKDETLLIFSCYIKGSPQESVWVLDHSVRF